MMQKKKIFIDPLTVRNNGIRMLYVPLRGGAALGNIISEVFKLLVPEAPAMYCAVAAHSYRGFNEEEPEMHIDGWTTAPQAIRALDRVLLVDDIFDTGKSANILWEMLQNSPSQNFRLAVHDYKEYLCRPPLPKVPDYFAAHHKIEREQDDFWIHYGSHELDGLSAQEREEHYYREDPALREILEAIFSPPKKQGV